MRHTNLYCSTCRRTNVFWDRPTFFECGCCKKHLVKAESALDPIMKPPAPGIPAALDQN